MHPVCGTVSASVNKISIIPCGRSWVLNRRCSSHAALLPQLQCLYTLRCDNDSLKKAILFSPNLRELGLVFSSEPIIQPLDLILMTLE